MQLIDTHAHIYTKEFDSDQGQMLERAFSGGVTKILMPNIDHRSIEPMLEIEAENPEKCYAMMGLHPCSATKDFQRELYLAEDWLNKRKFIAIGETGIDLYWDKTFLPQQQEALKIQAEWAKKYKVPIVLHTREAFDETYQIMAAAKDENLTGVFHCFSGTLEEAKKATEMGFKLGIGGVCTFKNGGLDKILPEIDLEHIILETDSPYLAPVPHRGKRNEPHYLNLIAKRVGELTGKTTGEVAEETTKNALQLFKLNAQ